MLPHTLWRAKETSPWETLDLITSPGLQSQPTSWQVLGSFKIPLDQVVPKEIQFAVSLGLNRKFKSSPGGVCVCVFRVEKRWPQTHELESREAMCKTIGNAGESNKQKWQTLIWAEQLKLLSAMWTSSPFLLFGVLPPVDWVVLLCLCLRTSAVHLSITSPVLGLQRKDWVTEWQQKLSMKHSRHTGLVTLWDWLAVQALFFSLVTQEQWCYFIRQDKNEFISIELRTTSDMCSPNWVGITVTCLSFFTHLNKGQRTNDKFVIHPNISTKWTHSSHWLFLLRVGDWVEEDLGIRNTCI